MFVFVMQPNYPLKQPTPCNHLVCESCYPRLNTCPMCRAPLENGVPPMEVSVGGLNLRMSMAAFSGQVHIVRLLLDHGADDFNGAMETAASQGHLNIVNLIQERMNSRHLNSQII